MNPPDGVKDGASWELLQELDEYGEGLSQWEIDFVESLMKQLLAGKMLSAKQRSTLDEIIDMRVQ